MAWFFFFCFWAISAHGNLSSVLTKTSRLNYWLIISTKYFPLRASFVDYTQEKITSCIYLVWLGSFLMPWLWHQAIIWIGYNAWPRSKSWKLFWAAVIYYSVSLTFLSNMFNIVFTSPRANGCYKLKVC